MKQRTTGLLMALGLFGFLGLASASTIAHWRFEDGVAGTEHAGDQDDGYRDLSGLGNHLSSWWPEGRPMATAERPFLLVAQSGAENRLALDFDAGTGGTEGLDDLGTFGNGGGKMIESLSFSAGWTIEASFRPEALGWQVVLGKDGKPTAWGEPPFMMKIRSDTKKLQVAFFDDSSTPTVPVLRSIETEVLRVGQWYSVAATYDNATFKVYLKTENDAGYVLQGSMAVPAGASLNPIAGIWTVGRGMWNGDVNDWFNGQIDEIKISNVALDPDRFINSDGDTDGDGMIDVWELQYFASIAACAPGDDPEGDGLDNLLEYALDGNPTIDDAEAVSPTTRFPDPDNWEYVYNRRLDDRTLGYNLAYKLNLLDGAWTPTEGVYEVPGGAAAMGPVLEAVTNSIPVTSYGLTQAFLQLEVSGDVLFFGRANNPSPVDGDDYAIDDGALSWDAALGATSYNIYFSTNEAAVTAMDSGALVTTQAGTIFDASAMVGMYTNYYWRVEPMADHALFMPSEVWSFAAAVPAELGRGHRLVIRRGLLLAATVFPNDFGFEGGSPGNNIDWATWADTRFNSIDTHAAWINDLTGWPGPVNMKYWRWCENQNDLLNGTGNGMVSWVEEEYMGGLGNLVALQAGDEMDLADLDWVAAIKAAFDRWKVAYPNTLVYANQIGDATSGVEHFQRVAKPDMAFMDVYEFNSNGGTLDKMYRALSYFRTWGKLGIGDARHTEPIPYGMYWQCMNYFKNRPMGQSEVCLAMYSPVAYGYKAFKGWIYSRNGNKPLPDNDFSAEMFSGSDDSARTAIFNVVAENNRQLLLMGNSLVRLASDGVVGEGGVYEEGVYDVNDESSEIPGWTPSSIPNIAGISASDDVVISKFLPLSEKFDGPDYSNQTYFMLLNGKVPWADTTTTPADNAQTITLTIGGGITALESIDISTGPNAGTIETIPVTAGTVAITLDGGRGKLFKFATGAPFVGFYNGE